MNKTTFVHSISDIDFAIKNNFDTVIVENDSFSTLNGLNIEIDIDNLIGYAKTKNIKIIINADFLPTNKDLQKLPELYNIIQKHDIDTVRVQDIGVGYYLQKKSPELKIQLASNSGNHNNEALEFYLNNNACKIDKIIISNDFSISNLEKINKKIELPVFGQILLAHSKRPLLSEIAGVNSAECIETGKPENSFIIRENQHGHFLLSNTPRNFTEKIEQADSLLFDYRGVANETDYQTAFSYDNDIKKFKEQHRTTTIAVVRDVIRKNQITFEALRYIKKASYKIIDSSDKVIDTEITYMRDMDGNEIESVKPGELFSIPWQKSVSTGMKLV